MVRAMVGVSDALHKMRGKKEVTKDDC